MRALGSERRGSIDRRPAERRALRRFLLAVACSLSLIGSGPSSVAGPSAVPEFGVSLSASSVTGGAPLLVQFLATPSGGASPSVQWSFGDGSVLFGNDSASLSPAHWYEAPGAYDAVVTLRTGAAVARANLTVRVSPATVVVQIAATLAGGSAPQTVQFNATPTGGSGTYIGFAWSFGDGGVGIGPSVRYSFAHDGRFHVVVNVTDSSDDLGSGSIWINLSDPPPTSGAGSLVGWGTTLPTNWPYIVAGVLALAGLSTLTLRPRRSVDQGPRVPPTASTEASSLPLVAPGLVASHPGPAAVRDSMTGGVAPGESGPAVAPLRRERRDPGDRSPRRWKDVADQLILRLGGLGVLARDDPPTVERTQRGLADALGVGQNVVSKVLARLAAADIVVVRTRHVLGQPKRLKTYELTPQGQELAMRLRRHAGPGVGPPSSADAPAPDPLDRAPRS